MITIHAFELRPGDDRGKTFVFDNQRTGQFMLFYRNAGSVSGRHYHEGKVPYKMPEKLILVQGSMQINWKDLNDNTTGTIRVESPAEIRIPPMIWHEVIAITDMILLELNSIADGVVDTIKTDQP